jgi:hypothetical protein
MSRNVFSLNWLRNATLVTFAFLVMFAQVGQAAGTEPLNFFRNWFLTGDVRMAGVGLRSLGGPDGMAHGTIQMNNVPADGEVLSAYLYWATEEVAPSPIGMNGSFKAAGTTVAVPIVGTPLGNTTTNPACWSSGGTPGAANSTGRAYRADVRAILQKDANGNRIANGSHDVVLPDSGGNGNGNIVFTNGATLVVLYRKFVPGIAPGNPLAEPFRAIVAFDGPYTIGKNAAMTQPIGGFYQASGGPATFSAIVSNGQGDFVSATAAGASTLVDDMANGNLFRGTAGERWDNRTVALPLAANAASYSATIASASNQTCLTIVSLWTSTPVVDTDNDGLVQIWETNGMHLNPGSATQPATFGGCADYPSDTAHCVDLRPTVPLGGMGADPTKQDIFVEIDWLKKVGTNAHEHRPKPDALAKVISAFASTVLAKAEIHVHFDVGPNLAADPAYQNLPFIVPAAHAHGGDVIDEDAITCNPALVAPSNPCAYTEAALSWKMGFLVVKDGFAPNIGAQSLPVRNNIFHYALFAHSLGGPYDPGTGQPLTGVPWSVSGVAERPGGDLMVTLGKWHFDDPAADQTGTAIVQAGTLMHELGHNLGLSHAGLSKTPNCMPIYQSVMNYLYQVRGLTLDSDNTQYVDYSFGSLNQLTETPGNPPSPYALNEGVSLGSSVKYRTRYYGPVDSTEGATKHCDGSTIQAGETTPMARLEGSGITAPDWNNDGDLLDSNLQLDVDFSGLPLGDGVPGYGAFFVDSNDWAFLNLQQVGAKRSFGGMSLYGDQGDPFIDSGDPFVDAGDPFIDSGDPFIDSGDPFIDSGDPFVDAGDITRDAAASSIEKPVLTASPLVNAIRTQWTNRDGIAQIRFYDIYRSDPDHPNFVLVHTNGPDPTLPKTFWDDAVNDTAHSGKTCPANKTCYDTSYTYYIKAKDIDGNFSPKSNTATALVPKPKGK